MDKTDYRKKSREIRKNLDIDAISLIIQGKIRELEVYKSAKNIMLYYPKKGELDLLTLADDKKNFYLPRLENMEIVPCPWKQNDSLCLSSYKIWEPCTEPVPVEDIDLILIPGLCADIHKNRLGYGKGCYDRFLNKCRSFTIFAVPDELIFESVPVENFDKKVNIVISQHRVIY